MDEVGVSTMGVAVLVKVSVGADATLDLVLLVGTACELASPESATANIVGPTKMDWRWDLGVLLVGPDSRIIDQRQKIRFSCQDAQCNTLSGFGGGDEDE